MRVLLVDDEEELVSALAERLGMRDIDARWVSDGEAALALARSTPFDLAVLDMKMPGLSGLKLKERLRALQPELRVIFMTGYGSDQILEEIQKEQQGNVFLVKPVDIQDLIAAMNDLMKGKGEQAP